MLRVNDLEVRLSLLVSILKLMSDQTIQTSAKELQTGLAKKNVKVTKKTVNSILFSEGKRYVDYDRKNHKYSLKKATENDVKVEDVGADVGVFTEKIPEVDSQATSIFVCNRSYSFFFKDLGNLQLFSLKESGSKVSVFLNKSHPFMDKYMELLVEETSDERSVFEDYLIGLVNLSLNTPAGLQRERVDDYLFSLSKELRYVTSEKQ